MNDPEETRDDDTDRPDSSPDSTAFNYPDFKTELIVDSLEAIDAYCLSDTFLCPFTTVLRIQTQLAEDWARAFSRVCETLITALELPEAPDKNAKSCEPRSGTVNSLRLYSVSLAALASKTCTSFSSDYTSFLMVITGHSSNTGIET